MAEYRVYWMIDIEASSPRAAAEEALEIQRDPNSIATAFEVIEKAEAETNAFPLAFTTLIDLGHGDE